MDNKFGFNDKDLTFLAEWIDKSLDDARETVRVLQNHKHGLPDNSDISGVFDPTIEYLRIAIGALDRASIDLTQVNYLMFCKDLIKPVDYTDFKPKIEELK